MKIWYALLSIVPFAIAVIIFVFASGARRIYGGLFFVIMGIAVLMYARRRESKDKTKE